MATDKQKAHALISYFQKKYREKHGSNPPAFNRHALSWGFEAMVMDYPDRGEEIIDYFFDTYKDHSPTKLTYEYGRIVDAIEEEIVDAKRRAEIRRKTRERMRHVRNRRQGDQGGPDT